MHEFRSVPNADKGGGGHKIPKFCGRHIWMAPYVKIKVKRVSERSEIKGKMSLERLLIIYPPLSSGYGKRGRRQSALHSLFINRRGRGRGTRGRRTDGRTRRRRRRRRRRDCAALAPLPAREGQKERGSVEREGGDGIETLQDYH